MGQATPGQAVELLLTAGQGNANAAALAYRTHLKERGLAPATIARRLAALRGMVKLARTLGRVAWSLDIQGPKSDVYRDTSGPGLGGWRSMLEVAKASATTPRGKRNLAILRLLHDNGLRRGEAVSLDVDDVDLEGGTVAVIGKGKEQAVRLTLSDAARAALADWLEARGREPGPLFVRCDGADGMPGPGRLDAGNVYRMVRAVGRRAGVTRGARPHGLRHLSISRLLDLTAGDVRRVQRFSRHSKIETLLRYDDNRRDDHGTLARMLGADS
jgi:integrase/recombinase XerC